MPLFGKSASDQSAHQRNEPRALSFLQRKRLPEEWAFAHGMGELDGLQDASVLLQQLEEEAKANLQPEGDGATGPREDSLSTSTLVEFAIQTWRFERRIDGMDPEKNKRERKQFADSCRRFKRLLAQFEVEIEDPVGQSYKSGWLDVEVVSWDEPEDEHNPVGSGPWVKQTISPIIRQGGRRIATGQIVCVDVEED